MNKNEEMDEIYKRFNKGGILYFIERTEKNQFYYKPLNLKTSADEYTPDQGIDWSDTIHSMMILSGGFLTKEDAEKENSFTTGGCRYCGHGSTIIPTIVTEHEFVPEPPKKRKCIVCEIDIDNEVWCDMHTPLI